MLAQNILLRGHNLITHLICKSRRHPLLSLTRFTAYHPHACGRRYCCSQSKTHWQFHKVNPNGKLIVRNGSEARVNFRVSLLDLQLYPHQDEAKVSVSHEDVFECSVDTSADVLFVSTHSPPDGVNEQEKDLQCHIEVPVSYNVDAQLDGHSSLSVSNLENQDVDISVQHGQCHLRNVKTNHMQVRSVGGAIVSEDSLQGNISIQSNNGSISLHKPVGQSLMVQTVEGDISIKNLYALSTTLIGQSGDIKIGSCHGNTKVHIKYHGNLKIGSLDGTLRADLKGGHADVMLAQTDWLNIVTGRGDVTLRVPESLPATLELQADEVDIDKSLAVTNREDIKENEQTRVTCSLCPEGSSGLPPTQIPHIISRTKSGSLSVRCQDWLSGLNLGKS